MRNLFQADHLEETIARINQLTPTTKGQWGKMTVAQMLAHCNVAYDMTYTDIYAKPNAFKRFFIKLLAKKAVVGPKPYPKNGATAPEFKITEDKDFAKEKQHLIANLKKTYELGFQHFHNKESHSFGPLTSEEWNTMFSKHLDHHLTQFGV